MRIKRFHVYLTLVFLCSGYLIAFTYSYTQERETDQSSFLQWEQEDQLRQKIIEESEENAARERHLRELQQRVSEKEEDISVVQSEVLALQKELEKYRLVTGLSAAKGTGILVVMEDSEYASDAQNPNDFIIHEQDVQMVVNELFAAGAEGVSINGQRVIYSTAIRCVGPTIIVNDVKSTVPFEITAIGDATILAQALHLPGGVLDTLQTFGISIKVEKKDELILPAYLGEF